MVSWLITSQFVISLWLLLIVLFSFTVAFWGQAVLTFSLTHARNESPPQVCFYKPRK